MKNRLWKVCETLCFMG